MEIKNPIILILCFITAMVLLFIDFRKKREYTEGKKVANTKFIKETEYYKQKVRTYKILSNTIKILCAMTIVIAGVLVARPVTEQTKTEDRLNRDIFIGLDISLSECEVNLKLVQQFKEILPNIEGDRIGIVTYNTAPIVYCPLTDDYGYVEECLNNIEKQMKIVEQNNGNIPYDCDPETYTFWYGGVLTNNEKKGSSLVGDGLARNNIFIPGPKNKYRKN